MKLLLHYGKPKTGTTSLQHALHRGRHALLERGVLYPGSLRPREDHRILTALFRAPREINRDVLKPFGGDADKIRKAAGSVFQDIRRQVERTRPKLLVLSSEYFYASPTWENQERFRDLLAELSDDIQICIYFRDPADQYLSGLQQALKGGGRVRPPRPTTDRARVELIESVFGRPIAAGISDADHLLGGDIVRDFGERFLGSQIGGGVPIASARLNQTISAEAMAILDRYRSWRYPEAGWQSIADSARLARMIAEIEARAGRSNKPRLKAQWAGEIRRSSTDLLWLRDVYGLVFRDVDYAAIDGRPIPGTGHPPRLEDLIEIDDAWRDEIVLRLLERGLRLDRLRDLGTLPGQILRKVRMLSTSRRP